MFGARHDAHLLGAPDDASVSYEQSIRFPVDAHWFGGCLLAARAPGKVALRVATPPVFDGGLPGIWSPEELLVAAVAACYGLTLVAAAEARGIPVHTLEVAAEGRLGRSAQGYRFTRMELEVELTTDSGCEPAAKRLALDAKARCIVEQTLVVPVQVRVVVRVLQCADAA